MCDAIDIYDLVVIGLFFFFDRDSCCACCTVKRKFLHSIRFICAMIVTVAEWVIIVQTGDETIGELTDTFDIMFSDEANDMPFKNRFLMIGMFMLVTWVIYALIFVMVACCMRANKFVLMMLFMAYFLMATMDIFMMLFTIFSGTAEGEKLIDYSSFSTGFRTTVFFVSIFDLLHSLIGLGSLLKNHKEIVSEIVQQDRDYS